MRRMGASVKAAPGASAAEVERICAASAKHAGASAAANAPLGVSRMCVGDKNSALVSAREAQGMGAARSSYRAVQAISCYYGARCRNASCRFGHGGDENSSVNAVNTRWRKHESGGKAEGLGGAGWATTGTRACHYGIHCRHAHCRFATIPLPALLGASSPWYVRSTLWRAWTIRFQCSSWRILFGRVLESARIGARSGGGSRPGTAPATPTQIAILQMEVDSRTQKKGADTSVVRLTQWKP